MSKLKIVLFLAIGFVFYKGFTAIKNFQIGVDKKVVQIEEIAQIEREGEVIALMMYLGDPPQLTEHLFVENEKKCLELKENAEDNSNAYYECAVVNAILTGNKIVNIIENIEIL